MSRDFPHPLLQPANDPCDVLPAYAELHCLSDFSFLRGASNAEDLFKRAAECGYDALAITDECSLAGIVRALIASEQSGVKLIVGSEFTLDDGLRLVLLVQTQAGYTHLCQLITQARRAADKGAYRLSRADIEAHGSAEGIAGLFALWLPGHKPQAEQGEWLRALFATRAYLAVELHRDRDDAQRLAALLALSAQLNLPAVAAGDVHMHSRSTRILQDTMTAIRHGLPLSDAGAKLFRNGERHLRQRRALSNIYPPALLETAVQIARQCRFDLRRLHYVYPAELVPSGATPASHLRALTEAGLRTRWPSGTPSKVRDTIESELTLIAKLGYEAFFLTVEDIVRYARSLNILCQGRGSSANSAVCYALGITSVNPEESRLLMARFLSEERNEPPDIDVDFEHERREEVLQYVYSKYGRERTALAATVIRYRGRSAVRDVARAFGLPADQITLLSGCYSWGNGTTPMEQRLRDAGFDPENALIQRIVALAKALRGHPRHLSQHVGGFVISDTPLWHLVPVENAAMPERTIIQWDKDDLEEMKLLKVDCLALGMLSCIRKAFDLLRSHRARDLCLATVPQGDTPTFEMIQLADTVGVFQIESRAQMSMLPRLKPHCFYDLVIEVAIVRPGPIQGGMVHPYLRRRMGKEEVTYPSEEVRDILGMTLGIPLFQEQVMELVISAGYSPSEADNLRRSMAAWKHTGDMEPHRARIREKMEAKGCYSSEFIDQIFEQIKGFGAYGFPQSHAASFAKLVYISCWLKRHEPAAFACALLNAQPMGFYAPSQIVQDARRGRAARVGVAFLPVDVMCSDYDNTLVGGSLHTSSDIGIQPAVRLGLRQIAGLAKTAAEAIVAARNDQPFVDIADLCRRSALDNKARAALAEAGALQSLAGHRHQARWLVAGVERQLPLLPSSPAEALIRLPAPTLTEEVGADYQALGLTLQAHPLSLLRPAFQARRIASSQQLQQKRHGCHVRTVGLVTMRQKPETAKRTMFVTLEDEFGAINVVVWEHVALRRRKPLLGANLLAVQGRWETVDGVSHLIAQDMQDLSPMLGSLHLQSRDFH